jgi:hypothetical protein
VLAVGQGGAATAPTQVLRYHVRHAIYGDIGSYSNTVERTGDTITVESEAHFRGTLLGCENAPNIGSDSLLMTISSRS